MFGRVRPKAPRAHQVGVAIAGILLVCSALAVAGAGAQQPVQAQPSQTYRYDQWDVFTAEPLTGNQLAVFIAPRGLTPALMQNIAREMAFSETTFIFSPEGEGTDFRVRIFGPNREFAFAGHPTIGTAFALARAGLISPGAEQVVFGEGVGPIIVELEWRDDHLRFAWMHDLPPTFGRIVRDVSGMAGALGLEPAELASSLPVQAVSGGASFLFVPLKSRAAVDRATLNTTAAAAVLEAADLPKQSIFIFSQESAEDRATVYGRKLGLDGREDPATGSAAGPLGGYLVRYGVVSGEGADSITIRQGVRMGRPSRLHVRLGLGDDEITDVRVGGSSVFVGAGTIILSDD